MHSLFSRALGAGALFFCALTGLHAQSSLLVNTTAVNLSSTSGSSTAVSQTIAVSSSTSTNFTVQIAPTVFTPAGAGWLSVDRASATTPGQFIVSANASALNPGSYNGTIQISSPGAVNSPVTIPVTFVVGGATQLAAAPASLTFTYDLGGTLPAAQRLAVTSGGQPAAYSAVGVTVTGAGWLAVSPATGTTPGAVDVSIPAGILTGAAPGTYTGYVALTPTSGSSSNTLQVPVTLTVTGTPQFKASPAALNFNYQTGQANPPQQTVNLNLLGGITNFRVTPSTNTGGNWLVVTPTLGVTPAALTVGVAANSLSPGTYTGTLQVSGIGSNASPLNISVTLTVSSSPLLSVAPNALTFNYQPGGAIPPAQTLTPSSTSAALPFSVSVSATGGNWLVVNPVTSTTPNPVSVSVDPSSLLPGVYNGSVIITGLGAGNPPQTIPVTLTVANTPILTVSAPSLTYNYQLGKSFPVAQIVNVNSSGAPFTYNVTFAEISGLNYVALSQTTGTTPGSFSVSMNPTTLAAAIPGLYQANVIITAPGAANSPLTIPLTLIISDKPLVNVGPASLSFNYQQGTATLPAAQFLSLTSTSDAATFSVTSASNGGWLTVGPSSGSTPSNITVQVTPLGLNPGTYNGSITVVTSIPGVGPTPNSPTVIPVTMVVTGGSLTATPASLTFNQAQGGTAPASQTINLTSTGIGFNYSTSATTTSGSWLTVTPANGSTPGSLTVSANGTGLTAGTYNGLVTVSANGAANTPLNIPVTLVVGASQTLTVAPATLAFSTQIGATAPAAQTIAVSSSTAGLAFAAAAVTSSGGTWLTVTPASGTTNGTVSVAVNAAGLAVGTYTGTVTITSAGAGNSPQTVAVTLTVANVPTPVPSFLVNAASFAPGPVAPGELITIGGTNIGPVTPASFTVTNGRVGTVLSDTQVFFDGIPATLLYTSQNQINAIVPYNVFGRTVTRVTTTYRGQTSAPIDVRVVDAAPGIFAVAGSTQGAILNQSGTVNAPNNPAPKNSVIVLYATGEGQTAPLGVDGLVIPSDGTGLKRPVLPVTVTIGGLPAVVEYAGAAPGFVSGVLQVNVRVPQEAASGSVPVVVTVGTAPSQAGLTASVQ